MAPMTAQMIVLSTLLVPATRPNAPQVSAAVNVPCSTRCGSCTDARRFLSMRSTVVCKTSSPFVRSFLTNERRAPPAAVSPLKQISPTLSSLSLMCSSRSGLGRNCPRSQRLRLRHYCTLEMTAELRPQHEGDNRVHERKDQGR